MVEPQNIQRLRKRGGEAIQPELERTALARRQCEEEGRPRGRFDGAIQIAIIALVRDGSHRLDPAGGNPPTDDWQ
jgi:hypothetical protein